MNSQHAQHTIIERNADMKAIKTKKDRIEYIAAWIVAAILKAIIVFGALLSPAIIEWIVLLLLGRG